MTNTSIVAWRLTAIPVEGFEFFPDVAVGMPFGGGLGRDVSDGLFQSAVTVRADERHAGRCEESGAAPAAAFDGHAEPAEADAAAGALIENDEDEQAEGKEAVDENGDGPGEIVGEAWQVGVEEDFGFGEEAVDGEPETMHDRGGGGELRQEKAPVFHRAVLMMVRR